MIPSEAFRGGELRLPIEAEVPRMPFELNQTEQERLNSMYPGLQWITEETQFNEIVPFKKLFISDTPLTEKAPEQDYPLTNFTMFFIREADDRSNTKRQFAALERLRVLIGSSKGAVEVRPELAQVAAVFFELERQCSTSKTLAKVQEGFLLDAVWRLGFMWQVLAQLCREDDQHIQRQGPYAFVA